MLSYYGIINLVTFNVGHHVEHHDFPYISGRNLPIVRINFKKTNYFIKNLLKIRKIAFDFYENLVIHSSWISVMYNFVVNPKIRLSSRVKRKFDSSEFQFYDKGAYATSYVYDFFSAVGFFTKKHVLGENSYLHGLLNFKYFV